MKVISVRLVDYQRPICAPCMKFGAALLAIAGLGLLALLTASALYRVKEDALVFRGPSEALGNIQNLVDLVLIVAGRR